MSTTPHALSQEQRKKIHDFMTKHPIGVLATVDSNGDPHASAIYAGVDKDLNVTFTTKRDTAKHANIQKHHTVMVVIYDAATQTTVQLSGQAREATNLEEIQHIFHATLEAAEQTGEDAVPPIAKISAGSYIAYKIVPDNIWMTEYGWGDSFRKALKYVDKAEQTEDPA